MTLELFPHTKLTPKLLLAKALENADDLESVILVRGYKDGTTETTWSRQELRDVAFSLEFLRQDLMHAMKSASQNKVEDAS